MQSSKKWTKEQIENHLCDLFINNCSQFLSINIEKLRKEKKESPDYILCDGNNTIGLEITRALDQNLQKATSIRDSKFKSTSFCPTLFEGEDMKGKEIEKWLKKSEEKLIGKPYKGNDLEEKVVDNIVKAIENKISKFDTYKKFQKNLLLIHVEDRATLEHNFVVRKLNEYTFSIDMKFDYFVLKLGLKFYFFDNIKA